MTEGLIDALQALRTLSMPHRNYVEAYEKLHAYVHHARARTMVLIVGPTGSGKTSMLQELERDILGKHPNESSGNIPFLYTRASNNEQARYSWRDHYVRSLSAVNEPLIGKKVSVIELAGIPEVRDARRRYGSNTEVALRSALESVIRNRQMKAYAIDEAHLLLRVGRATQRAADQLDSLQCFCDESKAPLLLAGVYELLEMWHLSAQLIRRCRLVEVKRYRRVRKDLLEFDRILMELDRVVPLASEDSYRNHNWYLWELSYGCIGKVIDLIDEALVLAIACGSKCFKWADIVKIPRFEIDIRRHRKEIDDGEALLSIYGDPELAHDPATSASPRRRRRPGERNPNRDPAFGHGGRKKPQ